MQNLPTLAVLSFDGVTEEPVCALFARRSVRVVEANHAEAADPVARPRVAGVNVAVALARGTRPSDHLRLSEIARTTVLTSSAHVVWFADTVVVGGAGLGHVVSLARQRKAAI